MDRPVDGNVPRPLRPSRQRPRGMQPRRHARGPQWRGTLGQAIHCGGIRIEPGDLIIGDDDGVVAVPLAAATDELSNAATRASRAKPTEEVRE